MPRVKTIPWPPFSIPSKRSAKTPHLQVQVHAQSAHRIQLVTLHRDAVRYVPVEQPHAKDRHGEEEVEARVHQGIVKRLENNKETIGRGSGREGGDWEKGFHREW